MKNRFSVFCGLGRLNGCGLNGEWLIRKLNKYVLPLVVGTSIPVQLQLVNWE